MEELTEAEIQFMMVFHVFVRDHPNIMKYVNKIGIDAMLAKLDEVKDIGKDFEYALSEQIAQARPGAVKLGKYKMNTFALGVIKKHHKHSFTRWDWLLELDKDHPSRVEEE